MDKQEIFDTVTRHLFTQGKPARGDGGVCLYRSDDGLKCAVGCLIPDEMYDPKMDEPEKGTNAGTGINSILSRGFTLPDWFDPNSEILGDLQTVHDSWYGDPVDLKRGLIRVSSKHELNKSVIDEEYTKVIDKQ